MIDGKLCMGDATAAGGWSYVDYLVSGVWSEAWRI